MKALPPSRRRRLLTLTLCRNSLISLRRIPGTFSTGKIFFLFLTVALMPLLAAAKERSHHNHYAHYHNRRSESRLVVLEASHLYSEMRLKDSGLDEKALVCAMLGYHRLLRRHLLRRTDVLSVCDFSQPSSVKRMYVIDVHNRRLLYRTYVAHGIRSGREYANSFSNRPNSHKSSLGFFVTRDSYIGSNGLSLRIDGLEKGFNDR